MFLHVASTLGIKQLFTSPYYPQGSGYIENMCNYLKTCKQKKFPSELARDEIVHIGSVACCLVPNKHMKECILPHVSKGCIHAIIAKVKSLLWMISEIYMH